MPFSRYLLNTLLLIVFDGTVFELTWVVPMRLILSAKFSGDDIENIVKSMSLAEIAKYDLGTQVKLGTHYI
jgi:hypothetical protein